MQMMFEIQSYTFTHGKNNGFPAEKTVIIALTEWPWRTLLKTMRMEGGKDLTKIFEITVFPEEKPLY